MSLHMKYKYYFIKIGLLFCIVQPLCGQIDLSQQVIGTMGTVAANNQISLSYSVGESVIQTSTGAILLTQGFQQSFVDLLSISATITKATCSNTLDGKAFIQIKNYRI